MFHFQIENGVAEINFNSRQAVSYIGLQNLEELDGSYLYIVASVLETAGKLLFIFFFHLCRCKHN